MTPEEVARADQTRNALLKDLARRREAAQYAEQARLAAQHQRPSSHVDPRDLDRGGPGFGL